MEPEPRDRVLYARASRRRDVVLAVDEARDRLMGHPGKPRDVPDGHSLPRRGWAQCRAPFRVTGHTLATRPATVNAPSRTRERVQRTAHRRASPFDCRWPALEVRAVQC